MDIQTQQQVEIFANAASDVKVLGLAEIGGLTEAVVYYDDNEIVTVRVSTLLNVNVRHSSRKEVTKLYLKGEQTFVDEALDGMTKLPMS